MKIMRRYTICAVFIVAWMACGWCLPHGTDLYLFLGIPLVVIFQLGIARRPLRQLWVRDGGGGAFRLDRTGVILAVGLILVSALNLMKNWHSWKIELGFVFGIVGAIPAAFALRRQTKEGLRRGLPSFAAAIVLSLVYSMTRAQIDGRSILFSLHKLPLFVDQFLVMFSENFVVEEVVFRGAIDTYLAPVLGDPLPRWTSAVFVSSLWGLWHLPLNHPTASEIPLTITIVVFASILLGVPLSFCWRRGGTLVLSSTAHALSDCYRNMIWP
jgi:membrane protease YdiL (CAAX protease family)